MGWRIFCVGVLILWLCCERDKGTEYVGKEGRFMIRLFGSNWDSLCSLWPSSCSDFISSSSPGFLFKLLQKNKVIKVCLSVFSSQIRLALQKNQDLTKPLASCLLQRQLSVAAAMATLPSFPLRPASNPSPSLFQSQPLPQALLHSVPGPICSAHTPVLFSPYWPQQRLNQLWVTAKSWPETRRRSNKRQCFLYSLGFMDHNWWLTMATFPLKEL